MNDLNPFLFRKINFTYIVLKGSSIHQTERFLWDTIMQLHSMWLCSAPPQVVWLKVVPKEKSAFQFSYFSMRKSSFVPSTHSAIFHPSSPLLRLTTFFPLCNSNFEPRRKAPSIHLFDERWLRTMLMFYYFVSLHQDIQWRITFWKWTFHREWRKFFSAHIFISFPIIRMANITIRFVIRLMTVSKNRRLECKGFFSFC